MARPRHITPRRTDHRRAFTLVEILIVVVILGILAAIVVPAFAGATDDSRKGAFIANLRNFATAADMFMVKEGRFLEDGSTGVMPAGFEDYAEISIFESPTPIGGEWDTEFEDNGFTSAIGVVFTGANDPGEPYMTEIDATFDDGDLAAGIFQQGTDALRYYYVIEP